MYPLGDNLEFLRNLETILIYGSYSKVFESTSYDDKKIQIEKIVSNYLYKDVLKFQSLKNAEIVRKLRRNFRKSFCDI